MRKVSHMQNDKPQNLILKGVCTLKYKLKASPGSRDVQLQCLLEKTALNTIQGTTKPVKRISHTIFTDL